MFSSIISMILSLIFKFHLTVFSLSADYYPEPIIAETTLKEVESLLEPELVLIYPCDFKPSERHPNPNCPPLGPLINLFSDWNYEEVYIVIMCESAGDSNAISYSGAVGLGQIHPYNELMYDPIKNIEAMHWKWIDGLNNGNRWYHWNNFGTCGWFD